MREPKPFKTRHLILLLVIILISAGYRIYASWWPKAVIKLGGQSIKVLVADTAKHRFQGWSNKKNMGKYDGMLFVFPERGQHTMVMRDMRFPLDIIWVDGTKIVEIAPNLQPEPGKSEAELTPYFSRRPSTLVLELPAGFKERTGVKIGDEIEIIKQ